MESDRLDVICQFMFSEADQTVSLSVKSTNGQNIEISLVWKCDDEVINTFKLSPGQVNFLGQLLSGQVGDLYS